jgi:uncharacterized protein YdaU (DUF1376 family)
VNYYDHHIGDYDQATAHLTACEDGIYSRLIRWYYASEAPLPLDIKLIQRRVRAHSKDERAAVEAVLSEFFEAREDGYHQHRCDEGIAAFKDKQRKAKASADARWSHRQTQCEGNANASPDAMRTHSERNANGMHRAPVPSSHTPDTKHQEENPPASRVPPTASPRATPAKQPKGNRLPDDWQLPRPWGDWALAEYPQWTPDKVRIEAAKFADHWRAATGKAATKADWQATWRNWCRSDIAHRDDHKPGRNGSVITVDAPETIAQYQARMAAEREASVRGITTAPPEVMALAGKLKLQ